MLSAVQRGSSSLSLRASVGDRLLLQIFVRPGMLELRPVPVSRTLLFSLQRSQPSVTDAVAWSAVGLTFYRLN